MLQGFHCGDQFISLVELKDPAPNPGLQTVMDHLLGVYIGQTATQRKSGDNESTPEDEANIPTLAAQFPTFC